MVIKGVMGFLIDAVVALKFPTLCARHINVRSQL